MADKIKGGLADSKTLNDIAEKHGVTLSAIESALADGIKVEMEHTDDKATATEIAKDHLFEDAEYYSKLANMEKQNAIGYTNPVKIQTISVKKGEEWSKTYVAAGFIEKGVCTYNEETVYISQETLNRCIHTIKCKPNVIKHQKVTEDNVEELAVGSTTDIGIFNSETASFDVPFIIFKDEGKQKIADGWSVSCAYIPKAFGKGGTWHNTPYDREVTELEFTHLALVPDPRYEDAKIYENAMDDDDVSDEDRWITIGAEEGHKGKKILIKAGQTAEEAIKDKFSEWAGKSKDQQSLFDKKEYAPKKDYYKKKKESEKVEKEKQRSIEVDKKVKEYLELQDKYLYKGGITFHDFTTKSKELFKIKGVAEKVDQLIEKGTVKEFDINIDDEFSLSVKGKMKDLKVIEIIDGSTIKLSDNNKYKVTYTGTLEKITEKQNSTDNTTKETYNMEKIEVEQGFLASLIELAQKPFLNSKKEEKGEPKGKEDKKIDDDEMEYEGKKYSKKELVNAFESACAGKKAEEEKEKQNALEAEAAAAKLAEEEKLNAKDSDEDMEFFNSMQKLMAEAQTDADDKIVVHSQNKGLELGSKAFG